MENEKDGFLKPVVVCFSDDKKKTKQTTNQKSKVNKGLLGPTVKPVNPFDPVADCKRLYESMDGFGTNEDVIIDIVPHRCNKQRQDLKAYYRDMYNKSLQEDLESELNGDFEEIILALMMTPTEYDAHCLHDAVVGLGTTESVLIGILSTRSPKELAAIKEKYEETYDRDLEADIKGDTSFSLEEMLVGLLQGKRDQSKTVSSQEAREDAEKLYRDGQISIDPDDDTFKEILVKKNRAQVRATFEEYKKLCGNDIYCGIEKAFIGDTEQAYKGLAKAVEDPVQFYAERLFSCMKGVGTNDKMLIRIVVSRSERKMSKFVEDKGAGISRALYLSWIDLEDIKDRYKTLYDQTLAQCVQEECRGDYKKVLLAIIDSTPSDAEKKDDEKIGCKSKTVNETTRSTTDAKQTPALKKLKPKSAKERTVKGVTSKKVKKKVKLKRNIKVTLPNTSSKNISDGSRPGSQISDEEDDENSNTDSVTDKKEIKIDENEDKYSKCKDKSDSGTTENRDDKSATDNQKDDFEASDNVNKARLDDNNDENYETEKIENEEKSDKISETNDSKCLDRVIKDSPHNQGTSKNVKNNKAPKETTRKEVFSKANTQESTQKAKKKTDVNQNQKNKAKKEQSNSTKGMSSEPKSKSTKKLKEKDCGYESEPDVTNTGQSELETSNAEKVKKRPKTADVGTQCGTLDPNEARNCDIYSPDEDCIQLHESLYGRKIDKNAVNDLLSARTVDQRLNMVQAYQRRYGKDAVQDIRSTFKGDYKDACVALLQDQATQDAELLNYSVKGMGTNEAALIHILASRTPELNKGEDDNKVTDERVTEVDARRIWRPGERPTQDNEDVLIEILTSFDREQLAAVCHIYQKITEIEFKDAIRRSTKGDFQDALLAMTSFLEDSANYYAELLHRSLKGFRSNDRVVINILISRMETDLSEIDAILTQQYSKTLYDAVKSNYSGDFARLLLQVIENHVQKKQIKKRQHLLFFHK